jgi:hypothetical protein
MITHIVMITWKPETPQGHADVVAAQLRELPAAISSIRSYQCGSNLGLTPGAADFAVVATFDDEAGWREYSVHPNHVSVRDEVMVPWIQSATRIQFAE